MLTIRKAQMAAFGQAARSRFAEDLADHIQEFFPRQYEFLGRDQVRAIVGQGTLKAVRRGFAMQPEIYLYVSLMFMLGSNFDSDVQLPWVAPFLDGSSGSSPGERIDELYSAAMEFLDTVAGEENEHLIRALVRVRALAIEELPRSPSAGFSEEIHRWLEKLYPERTRHLGPAIVQRLSREGLSMTQEFGITGPHSAAVVIGHMFFLGSGFNRDLQFPWVSGVLFNDSLREPDAKAKQLLEGSQRFLRHALGE